ncbi:MAG: ribonuclease H-like domain-containing protein [bacterium]
MGSACRAYIDIETTGLNRYRNKLTVVGICLEGNRGLRVVQLYDDTLTAGVLLDTLEPASIIYSYNGARFDLPFIERHLGVNLRRFTHCDLMHHCWRSNLWGGLKAVEHQLGIGRETGGIDGLDAVRLWRAYRRGRDPEALSTLLRYNAEDVTNLALIRRRLRVG